MLRPKISEPIPDPGKNSSTWKLYDKYLSYILPQGPETDWYPLSIFINRVLMASTGYYETFSLELAVAVEGILLTELTQLCRCFRHKLLLTCI